MFQKYCVVFQELFVVFADMGHRTPASWDSSLCYVHLNIYFHCLFILVLTSPNGEWPIKYTHTHTHTETTTKSSNVFFI